MSKEMTDEQKLARLRAQFDAWNAGDMERFKQGLHADVVLHPTPDWPERGPFEGPDAYVGAVSAMREAFSADQMTFETDDLPIEVVGERIVGRMRWSASGASGDAPGFEVEFTAVWDFRDGMVIRQRHFWDHDEALATAAEPD